HRSRRRRNDHRLPGSTARGDGGKGDGAAVTHGESPPAMGAIFDPTHKPLASAQGNGRRRRDVKPSGEVELADAAHTDPASLRSAHPYRVRAGRERYRRGGSA